VQVYNQRYNIVLSAQGTFPQTFYFRCAYNLGGYLSQNFKKEEDVTNE
jgi:hypothetical protein